MAQVYNYILSKQLLFGALLAALLGAVFALAPEAFAQTLLPLPGTAGVDVPAPQGDTAVQKTEDILGPIARVLRIILGAIAVLFIVVSGVRMVISGDNEETVKSQKQSMFYGVIGLMLISIAGPISAIFDFRQGNILENPDQFVARARLFDDTTRMVITYIRYALGGLATLMFMSAGFSMVVSSSNEEDLTRAKKNLGLGASGLLLIFVSDLVVRRIFFDAQYNDYRSQTLVQINQNELIAQIVGVTNLMVTFIAPIMLLGIVAGGILYVTAGGDEERTGLAKKIMTNSVIGVVIVYGAFSLVSTVIAGVF